MARRRSNRQRALFALVTAVIVLDLGEVLARLYPPPDPRAPATGGGDFSVLLHGSPWLLWEIQPGDRVENGNSVHVNELGFRGATPGPKSRPRAMSLGDSSIYGYGVKDDEVFTSVLGDKFDADFINGGVPGYSSFQSLNLLDMRGLALEPDLLLVGNLWSDNNFDTFVDRDLLATYAGWQGSTGWRVRTALSHSALFRWVDFAVRVGPQGTQARKVGWQLGSGEPGSGTRRVAVNDYAANLDGFCDRMRMLGGGVVFVVLPSREDIDPLSAGPGWEVYRNVMRETAKRHNVPVVEAPEAFKASGHTADDLFLDLMHPTPLGHALLADTVAASLTAAGWPATPLRVSPPSSERPVYTDRMAGRTGGAE